MTEQQAKAILMAYRPGTEDDDDPAVVEALAMVRQSEQLREWFNYQRAVQDEIRAGFKNIPVPEGFREQIVSEYRARDAGSQLKARALMLAVAVILTLGIIFTVRFAQRTNYAEDDSFAAYRSTMVRTVLRTYAMDLETDDLGRIRSFLAEQHSVADWVLPKPLEQTASTGCGILRWQGRPVSMICFHSGRPLETGEKTDVFLFIIENSSLTGTPQDATVEFSRVNDLVTASWTTGGKTYVLATEGDDSYIRRFL